MLATNLPLLANNLARRSLADGALVGRVGKIGPMGLSVSHGLKQILGRWDEKIPAAVNSSQVVQNCNQPATTICYQISIISNVFFPNVLKKNGG